MNAMTRKLTGLVLGFGVIMALCLYNSHEASGQEKKDAGKVHDAKADADKKGTDYYQHIYRALEQLRQGRHALEESIKREEKEGHVEKAVIKELHESVKDVNKAIERAEKAVKVDRKDQHDRKDHDQKK